MILIKNQPDSQPLPCVATIGFFDGVHKGHLYLINQVTEEAKAKGLHSAVITFPEHPRHVMNKAYQPELLTTYEEKAKLLANTGIDYCFALDFTPDISRLSAYDFMKKILKDRFNVQSLLIGHDHRFGHNRSESFDDYCLYGEKLGIDVIRTRACVIDDTTVSSSVIRRLLESGEVDEAAHFLGYPYFIEGTVVDGYKVGRTLGFPTANIAVDHPDKLIPANGVYAVYITVKGSRYAGMLNIGHRPTINNGNHRSIEVHILNFHSDIYNFPVRMEFIKKIREEMKYSGKEQLIAQLKKDASLTESLLLD